MAMIKGAIYADTGGGASFMKGQTDIRGGPDKPAGTGERLCAMTS